MAAAHRRLTVLVLVCTAASTAFAITCADTRSAKLPNCLELAPNMVVHWGVAGGNITFNHTTVAPGIGWMALGLSETGSMKGSDMFVVQQQGGKWTLTDMWATGFVRPVADKQQTLALLGVVHQPARGLLSATYTRHLDPCDNQDMAVVRGNTLNLLHAWGSDSELSYHGRNRGGQPVLLYPTPGKKAAPLSLPGAAKAPRVQRMNLSIAALTIPSKETTYMYQWFKLPTDKKYHVLSYKPLWGTTKDKYAHHAVVYACAPSMNAVLAKYTAAQRRPVEATRDMPRCNEFYMLVTPWSREYKLPPQAGLPFGNSSYTWWMLEMHYNNPEGVTGVKDQGSGITLEYTTDLRPHDMGLITLTQFALVIPPGRRTFSTPTSYCNAACTKRFGQPLNLVDQTFHMHGLGKSAITRRYRGGKELSPLGQIRYFDYKYQPILAMPEDGNVLLPGDELAFTCTFDSTSRTNVTREGPGTRDEMCFHWIYYWPAVPGMGVCSSVPATKDPKPRPAVGFCSQDFAVLFGARDPKTARQLYASGLLYNVTVPTGTPYKPPPCQGAAAAGAGVVPRAVTAAARVPTSG